MVYLFLYSVEQSASHLLSWWVLLNLAVAYLGATKTLKKVLKKSLGLRTEYKKYTISVCEPSSSPERAQASDSDSLIQFVQ